MRLINTLKQVILEIGDVGDPKENFFKKLKNFFKLKKKSKPYFLPEFNDLKSSFDGYRMVTENDKVTQQSKYRIKLELASKNQINIYNFLDGGPSSRITLNISWDQNEGVFNVSSPEQYFNGVISNLEGHLTTHGWGYIKFNLKDGSQTYNINTQINLLNLT